MLKKTRVIFLVGFFGDIKGSKLPSKEYALG